MTTKVRAILLRSGCYEEVISLPIDLFPYFLLLVLCELLCLLDFSFLMSKKAVFAFQLVFSISDSGFIIGAGACHLEGFMRLPGYISIVHPLVRGVFSIPHL